MGFWAPRGAADAHDGPAGFQAAGEAADSHDAGPAGGFWATRGAADAHDAGPAAALRQQARQLMLMLLGQLGLSGDRRCS